MNLSIMNNLHTPKNFAKYAYYNLLFNQLSSKHITRFKVLTFTRVLNFHSHSNAKSFQNLRFKSHGYNDYSSIVYRTSKLMSSQKQSRPDSEENVERLQHEDGVFREDSEEVSLKAAEAHLVKGSQFSLEGDLEAAEEEFSQALEIQIKLLGESDPVVGKTYMELGMISQAGKKETEAMEYYDKSLRILENQPEGVYNEDIATVYEFVGDIYDEEGNLEEAVGFYQEALELRKQQQELKSSGDEGNNLGGLYEKIGDCYVGLKKFGLAQEAYFEALEIFNRRKENSKVLDITPLLGYCAYQEGEFEDALKYYQDAIRLHEEERGAGEEDFEIVEIWEQIANIMSKKMDFKESILYNQKVLNFYLKNKLVGRTKDVYESLGQAYESEGLDDKAFDLYKSGIEEYIDYYKADHPVIDQLHELLTELAERIGRVDDMKNIERKIQEVKDVKEFTTDFLG